MFADDDKISTHEGIALGKDGQDITIELIAQENDEHTEKICQGKARKLNNADMLSQQLPNQFHR